MIKDRRLAFARARTPAAAALAAVHPEAGGRTSVFIGQRRARRVVPRDTRAPDAALSPRGCGDLH